MRKLPTILWICFMLGIFLAIEVAGPGSSAIAKDTGTFIVIGKSVRNQQGVVLGKVENVVLNEQGCAEYIILSGKFSGARGRYYPMPWSAVRRGDNAEYVLVDVDVKILREAPAISRERHIDVGSWGPKVHDFYVVRHKMGIQPGAKEEPRHDTDDKHKGSRNQKALREQADEKLDKEHASPSGKPGMEKQVDNPDKKKTTGAKEEAGSVERQIMHEKKDLPLKEGGETLRHLQDQGKGVHQKLEGAVDGKKSGNKPETSSPTLPFGTKKGGLPD